MKSREPRIAIVFDFDDTLAPDSTSSFLEAHGVEVKAFWAKHKKLLDGGWDPIPAYMEMMIKESRSRSPGSRFTKKRFEAFGKSLRPHKGLQAFFSRIENVAKESFSGSQVSFFIISSGIGDIISNFRCRDRFDTIWCSNFEYNDNDEISGIKNVISFTDKTRYLFEIQKGLFLGKHKPDPFAVNKKIQEADYFVHFDQMVMIGDGYTDVPCFSLVEKNGGTAIGVYERDAAEKWGKAFGLMSERRVKQMVVADFTKNSGLDDAISLAVKNILRFRLG